MILRREHLLRALLLSAVAMGVTGLSFADGQDDAAPTAPGIEEKADAVFKRMSNQLAAADAFTFEARTTVDQVLDDGQKIQYARAQQVAVRRPDCIAAVVSGDREAAQYWYKGTRLAMLNKAENAYTVIDVPDNIDAMFDHLAEKYAMTVPLSDLLFTNAYRAVMPNTRSGFYVGLHDVDGVKCHHLAFRAVAVDWQVWIEDGDTAVPRKIVITYKELPGDPQYIAFLYNWNLHANLPDEKFSFTPPPGAKQIELKDPQPQMRAGQQTR